MKFLNISLLILMISYSTIVILPNEIKESSLVDTNKKKFKNTKAHEKFMRKQLKLAEKRRQRELEKKEYKISKKEILTRPLSPMF